MPQTPERKAEYQRQRRAKNGDSPLTPEVVDVARAAAAKPVNPVRDEMRKIAKERGEPTLEQVEQAEQKRTKKSSEGVDFGGEHYWGAVSQAPEGYRRCIAFQFGNRLIGGCGKLVKWEGKPLPTNVNGEPDLANAIIDSDHYKEIQSKMPLTKTRG